MYINSKSKTGIVSYGAYIPRFRITVEEIAAAWSTESTSIKNGLSLSEKSVAGLDEDTITIATNAAIQAYNRTTGPVKIGAIYVGSESHPYAVKPSATIVGEALNISTNWTSADMEFACKAGTAAMQVCIGLVDSNRVDCAIAIGADTAQGAPGDTLEYSAAAGGAAYIMGNENVIAKVIHTTSFTTDTPDFWRREHMHFPKHGGRFTGEPAYLKHVVSATQQLLNDLGAKVSDFDHVVFHMPNGKFPQIVAKMLKVSPTQLEAGFTVAQIGNTYSGSSLIGLARVLDRAIPGQKILLTSYGSGAGSDSFVFEVTPQIEIYRSQIRQNLKYDKSVQDMINDKQYISYGQYIRSTKKLKEQS